MKKITVFLLVVAASIVLMVVTVTTSRLIVKAPAPESMLGISVVNPKPNDIISSPITISGSVNGQGWTGFEGQVGTVRLIGSNGVELALGILTATGDWMELPTDFKTTIEFDSGDLKEGSLVFKNENPSGEIQRDKTFVVPVTFK